MVTDPSPSQRTRSIAAFGILVGILLAGAVATPLFPALGAPATFAALGVLVALPAALMLGPRIGWRRALLLAGAITLIAAISFTLIVAAACLMTGCIG